MELFRKANAKENETSSRYRELRQQMLNLKPQDIGVTLDNDNQVFGAVVDMPINDNIATLICCIGGTVSLYYSNGGGMIGIGDRYEEVRKAGGSFLYSVGQILQYFKIVDNFSLPISKNTSVYLLTKEKIYKMEFNMDNLNSSEEHIQFLIFLIQNVLTKIRDSTTNM
jgi:hypothetical protein